MSLDTSSSLMGLAGGALIGGGSLLAFALTRKIPGISGVFAKILRPKPNDALWRVWMLLGLILGAGLAFWLVPGAATFDPQPGRTLPVTIVAGLLVGFGTRLGGGCTSGHGVCGIGRGVRDSIAATVIFMATAILTVWVWNLLVKGGQL